MSQNSNNQDYSNETDGFILGGGTTKRDLTVTGADITLTGSGTNTYTMPSSTDTLVGRASTDTLTNKTLTSPVVNSPTGIVKADVGLGNVDNTSNATELAATLLAVYPVGAIYISVASTNPGTLFGGTWAIYGPGKMLISLDSGDSDFDTAEETGGAKTHTITSDEMPAHTHTQNAHSHSYSDMTPAVDSGSQSNRYMNASGGGNGSGGTNNTTATNQNTGGGSAHNNMPPYIATYIWKRTA